MNRRKKSLITLCGVFLSFLLVAGEGLAQEKALELSANECIERALTENLSLKSSRMGIRLNELTVIQEKSSFDPSLSLNVSRGQSESPNYTSYIPVNSINEKSTKLNFTVGQNIATGAQWGVGFYNTLSESNVELEKNFSSYLGMNINQPLLKGFGKKINYSGI
ncbi:TolC family protein, partial [bacterium]|nr:TolC family protein [bacterium]